MATKNTTGDLRTFLFDAMKKAEKGELPATDGRNIVGLANQINLNLQAEIKRAEQALRLGQTVPKFGEMVVGD